MDRKEIFNDLSKIEKEKKMKKGKEKKIVQSM